MKGISRFLINCISLLCITSVMTHPAQGEDNRPMNVQLDPDSIKVGVFYHGSDVHVTAETQSCDGAVVVLKAGNEDITFNRKGRKAGIWLNVAQLTVSRVPEVYLLASSRNLDEICSAEMQRQLSLGVDALRFQMELIHERPLIGSEADEFFKLKAENGTYETDIPLQLTRKGENRTRLSAVLPISSAVPPGDYNLALYCFKGGLLTQQGTSELNIERVGLVDLLASLAYEYAALYGVLAILIAMMVGIVMGVIFHSLPGSGH